MAPLNCKLFFLLFLATSVSCKPKMASIEESDSDTLALGDTLADPSSCKPPGEVRKEMDRCEGRYPLLDLTGVNLVSFTIGQPQIPDEGKTGFSVPDESGSDLLRVKARNLKGSYRMTPYRLGKSQQKGWRPFNWGVGMLRNAGIKSDELRATAILDKSGGERQWLPVRFAPAKSYSLVISGYSGFALAYVRILGPDKQLVKECSGPIELMGDLLCKWDAGNNPPGIYSLIAQGANDPSQKLNVSLRHNPNWLLDR